MAMLSTSLAGAMSAAPHFSALRRSNNSSLNSHLRISSPRKPFRGVVAMAGSGTGGTGNVGNNLVLRAGKRGTTDKIGEFTMAFVETPNMSEIHWLPDPNSSNKYVQQAVISTHSRLFPPLP